MHRLLSDRWAMHIATWDRNASENGSGAKTPKFSLDSEKKVGSCWIIAPIRIYVPMIEYPHPLKLENWGGPSENVTYIFPGGGGGLRKCKLHFFKCILGGGVLM